MGEPVLWGSRLYRFDRVSGSGADILFKEPEAGFNSNLAHSSEVWAIENLKVINYKEIIEWYKQPFYMKWFTECPVKILKELEK